MQDKTKDKQQLVDDQKLVVLETEALEQVAGGFNRNDVDWRTVGRILCAPVGGC
jgi:hypothetical protein